MKRGEIWTLAGAKDYAGKPRPVAIVQENRFDSTDSITVCPLTTESSGLHIVRPFVAPTATTGLREPSRLMADKISTVPKTKLGKFVGLLDDSDMLRLSAAIIVFLGLADTTQPRSSSS